MAKKGRCACSTPDMESRSQQQQCEQSEEGHSGCHIAHFVQDTKLQAELSYTLHVFNLWEARERTAQLSTPYMELPGCQMLAGKQPALGSSSLVHSLFEHGLH